MPRRKGHVIAIPSPIAGFITSYIKLNMNDLDLFRKPVHLMSSGVF